MLDFSQSKKITQKICYIHVAKCGGTSLVDAIKAQYPLRERLLRKKCFINMNPAASLKASEILNESLFAYREKVLLYLLSINSNKFISGHFAFSDLAMTHFGDQWNFVTILRNPVDRWFSHFFFNRYKKSGHFKTDLTLEEYINSEDGQSLGFLYHRLFYGKPFEEKPNFKESYPKVIENIDNLACLGTIEYLDLFCRDFKKKFGVTLHIPAKNKNPLSHKDQSSLITDSIRRKVEEICEPDIRIFNYVQQKIRA